MPTLEITARAKSRHRRLALAVYSGLLLTLGSTVATQASTPDESVPSITVRYSDLDVTSDEGARALYQRILEAAQRVCDPHSSDVMTLLGEHYCRQQAIERAVRSVGSPRLAALHRASGEHG
jgi:UrcA family protein